MQRFIAIAVMVCIGFIDVSCDSSVPPRFQHAVDVSSLADLHFSHEIPSVYRCFLKSSLHDSYKVWAINGMTTTSGIKCADGLREGIDGEIYHPIPDNPGSTDSVDISIRLYENTTMASHSWDINYNIKASDVSSYLHVFTTTGPEGDRYCISDSMQGMSCPAGCNSPLNTFSSVIAFQKHNLIIEIRETTGSKNDKWKKLHSRELAAIIRRV